MRILAIIFLIPAAVCAGSVTTGFGKITEKFQSSPLVTIQLEKVVKSELLGKETTHQAKVFLGKGMFRLETESPEKALFVFDGKTAWNVQYPSEDFGGDIQVTKSKLDKRSKQQMLLVNILRQPLSQNFKVLGEKKSGDQSELELSPLRSELAIKKLSVKFADAKVESISYEDDLGNFTQMKFKKIDFGSKAKPELFKYKPEKGAQVNEL